MPHDMPALCSKAKSVKRETQNFGFHRLFSLSTFILVYAKAKYHSGVAVCCLFQHWRSSIERFYSLWRFASILSKQTALKVGGRISGALDDAKHRL